MSLKSFHRVFIVSSFACLSFIAWWASGHNAAALRTPWALNSAVAGMAALAGYFVWSLNKLR